MQQEEQLMATAERAAVLMEQFERRCELIEQRVGSLAQQVPGVVRQSSESLLRALPEQLLGAVRGGLDRSLEQHERRLQAAGREVESRVHALATRMDTLERLHRHLVWKAAAVALASLLLLLTGGAWLSLHYTQVVRRNQLSAELLQAYNAADVRLCEGQLCANVDAGGRRYGNQSQYLPVRGR